MSEPEVKTQGKYIVIYDRGDGNTPDHGSLSQIKSGDIVCVHTDIGHQSLVVDAVAGSKWTRRIRTKATTYQGHLMTKAQEIDPRTIRRVLRLKPGEKHSLLGGD